MTEQRTRTPHTGRTRARTRCTGRGSPQTVLHVRAKCVPRVLRYTTSLGLYSSLRDYVYEYDVRLRYEINVVGCRCRELQSNLQTAVQL